MAEYIAKHHRPQDDVPIEVIFKYLLNDYHKEQARVKMVSDYAKRLEERLRNMKDNRGKQLEELQEAHRKLKTKHKKINQHRMYLERLLKKQGIPFASLNSSYPW